MQNVNVHFGKSDNGNYNSRGSQGCITIHPEDVNAFFSNLYGLIPNKQQEYQMDVFLLLELNEKEI